MNFEELKKEYGIAVPEDSVFYSEDYKRYFSKGPENKEADNIQREKFEKYRQFNELYQKAFVATFGSNDPQLNYTNYQAVVLGGQSGAGKSALSTIAKEEFKEKGQGIYVIDDDQFRKFYPKADEIIKGYPEYYTQLTAIGTNAVTPKIMKYASEHGLNFVFDGTLKNKRIIETSSTWKDYTINWKIMATPRIVSLLSVFERNEALRSIRLPYYMVTCKVHDGTYEGTAPTLEYLESLPNIGRIQVYTRGENATTAEKKYDSSEKGSATQRYSSATNALESIRKEAKGVSRKSVMERIGKIEGGKNKWNQAELEAWEEAKIQIEEELKAIEIDAR